MSALVMIVIEIIGGVAMFKAWGWYWPVIMVIAALLLLRYTRWLGRLAGEAVGLVLYAVAVAETWPDFGMWYVIAAAVTYAFFIRALLHERRGY
ncbi:MAG: hypothetical protein RI947_608 [Candidatus Parcubacteria bacterium]